MKLPRTAWVLNLDAEIELDRMQVWLAAGHSSTAFSYATAKPVRTLIASHARSFAALLPHDAVVLGSDDSSSTHLPGALGVCWCPTPSALARLHRAGVAALAAPEPALLARVNHRRYCAELGQTLSVAQFVTTLEQMNEVLSGQSPEGQTQTTQWLCKRPLSFAGRGQRRIATGAGPQSQSLSDNQRWLRESVPHGGLQIEPFLPIVAEFSVHGLLHRNGQCQLGQLCQQHVDEHRAWSHSTTVLSPSLSDAHLQQLRSEAERVATALLRDGYFGPFNVDSYLWRDPSGALHLNPRSEINARLTMGYPVGMGPQWLDDLIVACGAD
jgi:hypothetical protein